MLQRHLIGWQRPAFLEGILFPRYRPVAGVDPGQRAQGQAETDRAVAGDQQQPLLAQRPGAGQPNWTMGFVATVDRQGEPHRFIKAARKDPGQPLALLLVIEAVFQRIDIDRQQALAFQVVPGVFVGGMDQRRVDPEPARQRAQE